MSQQDMDLLLWLHAEAVWQREADRLDQRIDWMRRQLAVALNRHRLTTWDELLVEANRVAEAWLDAVAAEADEEETAARMSGSLPQCAVHPEADR